VEEGGSLHRLLNTDLEAVDLPPEGIIVNRHLGKILGVEPGDLLTVEVLNGHRPIRQIPVVSFVRQFIGVAAYMELEALNRVLREGDAISGAYVAADSLHLESIYRELEEMPRVAGTVVRKNAIESFLETMAGTILIFTFINTILAGTIACGVVYNSARIALSERSRELASLRVLGFTRAEVSYILLGELAVLTLAAIPVGFLVGRGLCEIIVAGLQSDLYRIPLVLEARTYAFAATVVLVATVLSGLYVRRNLDRLDLVAVLKTEE
jgi:putative ABC transport system permease protein